jgi:hypothetical protein
MGVEGGKPPSEQMSLGTTIQVHEEERSYSIHSLSVSVLNPTDIHLAASPGPTLCGLPLFSHLPHPTSPRTRWLCSLCRTPTLSTPHVHSNINNVPYLCCSACWTQFKLSMIIGLPFRIIQLCALQTVFHFPACKLVLFENPDVGMKVIGILLIVVMVSPLLPAKQFQKTSVLIRNSGLGISSCIYQCGCCETNRKSIETSIQTSTT